MPRYVAIKSRVCVNLALNLRRLNLQNLIIKSSPENSAAGLDGKFKCERKLIISAKSNASENLAAIRELKNKLERGGRVKFTAKFDDDLSFSRAGKFYEKPQSKSSAKFGCEICKNLNLVAENAKFNAVTRDEIRGKFRKNLSRIEGDKFTFKSVRFREKLRDDKFATENKDFKLPKGGAKFHSPARAKFTPSRKRFNFSNVPFYENLAIRNAKFSVVARAKFDVRLAENLNIFSQKAKFNGIASVGNFQNVQAKIRTNFARTKLGSNAKFNQGM